MKDMMHHKGYFGTVHFDEESLIFYGKVAFVRALISYEATHAKGLKKAFQDAVEDYLALCISKNLKPEQPFKGSLNVRLGPELHRTLAVAALGKHVSLNQFIVEKLGAKTFDHHS